MSIRLLSNLGQCSGSCLQRDPGLVELCLKQRKIAKEEEKEEKEEEEKEGEEALRSFHHNQNVRQMGAERLGQRGTEHFNYPCLF